MHKRCSGLRNVLHAQNYVCSVFKQPHGVERTEWILLTGMEIQRVQCMMHRRVATAWSKWLEIALLLCNRRIPLRRRFQHLRGMHQVSDAVWLRNRAPHTTFGAIHRHCERRILHYLQDHMQSAVVAERCGLRQISNVLRTRRLRWYGHVRRK